MSRDLSTMSRDKVKEEGKVKFADVAENVSNIGQWKLKIVKDDRSAIQKKTFTKWINTYLIKVGQSIEDLYGDLNDGNRLLTLLEILTGDRLPRERGKMRFHKLQNVENALSFLKRKNIKLVNIRNDDIVDGNPKLILGLIWTIILNFEISHDAESQASAKANLMDWAKRATRGYNGIDVRNFTSSFRNGMAFNAIIHRFRPDIIDYDGLVPENAEENLENAFSVAEEQLGIPRLLDVEDFILDELDEKSIMTYLSAFNRMYSKVPTEEELAVKVYSDRINVDARRILSWLKTNIDKLEKKIYKMDPDMFVKYKADLAMLKGTEMPEKRELKDYLGDCYKNLKLAEAEDMITTDITMDKINQFWEMLERCLADKEAAVQAEDDRITAQNELADRIHEKAEHAAKKLDEIKRMITKPEEGADLVELIQEAKRILYNSNIEEDTRAMFSGVSALVRESHPRADDLAKEVQLISDELDEIKVRLDTLHEDLEQGAIDQLDSKLNDLLALIRQIDADLTADGYGDDLKSALRTLDKHLVTMDNVDNLEQDIKQLKVEIAENPRADYKQTTKLQDLEHEYGMLKSNCATKDQELREGIEFLESVQELKEWGEKAKEKELKFDWSAFNPQTMPYDKGIMKHQKKFDQLLTLGKQLIKTDHPMGHVVGTEVQELCELWTCLKDLACVAEKHIQSHNDHELFWKRLNNANLWIKQKRNLLDTRYNAKCLDVVSSSERLQELVDMKKDIVGYDPNIVQLSELGKVVVCLNKRKKMKVGEEVLALSPYKRAGTSDPLIERGDECQFSGDAGMERWRVKKGLTPLPSAKSNGTNGHKAHEPAPRGSSIAALVAEVPSCMFSQIPPDPECLAESEKTSQDYEELKIVYDKQRGYLKHIMVKHEFFSNCDVVLTWPYDKNFEVELRAREMVIANLQEAGEVLIADAEHHASSDSQEIADRQNAALDHWQDLLDKHQHKSSKLSELSKSVEDLTVDIADLCEQCDNIETTADNVSSSEKSLDKLLRDVASIEEYLKQLQEQVDEVCDESCADDFKPLITKLDKLQDKLASLRGTCENKSTSVEQLLSLSDLLSTVSVSLENIATTLAAMAMYPLDLSRVQEDIKKIQMISEELVAEDDHIAELEELQEHLKHALTNTPVSDEAADLIVKRDRISEEIDNRSRQLIGNSEPAITVYEEAVGHALHWLEDAEDKLARSQTQPSYKQKYQLVAALKSDVALKASLYGDLKSAQDNVVVSAEEYEGLLSKFATEFPLASPFKPINNPAQKIVQKEGNSVQDQYNRVGDDADRLIVVYETKYKTYERLKEELDLFLVWIEDTKTKIENPPKVLIQLKEVSRLKAQQQEMVDNITNKGTELEQMVGEVTDFVTENGEDKAEETAHVNEKLHLVQEEYTLILKAAKAQSLDLQETMDRVEKVVYWYNCLQQYLKNSRKRLEILDPVATDVVDVAKQLKNCKAITTELESKEELIEEMMKESEYLLSLADKDHLYIIPADLGDKVTSFRADWKKFCTKCRSQEKRLERTYTKLRKLEAALEKILRWQTEKEKELSAAPPISSDPSIIKQQLEQIKSLRAIVDGCESHITTANELARSLINKGKQHSETVPPLKTKLEKINEGWSRMDATITARLYDLESALKRSQGIEKALEEIRKWIEEKEDMLQVKAPLSINRDELQECLSKYTELKRDIHGYENVLTATTEKALEGLALDEVDVLKNKLDGLQSRYNDIRADCDEHQELLNELYKALDDLRRNVAGINGTIDRSKEQAAEMGELATNLPSLKDQLREVVLHLDGLDAITPDIASVVQEADVVCDLALLQAAPKLQRELLKLPKTLEVEVGDLEKAAKKKKKDIEDRINKLKSIEEDLDKFNASVTRSLKDFDRHRSDSKLEPEAKKELIKDFDQVHDDLEKTLETIKCEVGELLSDVEDTPFLKRRIQEAEQKLKDLNLALKESKDDTEKMESALDTHTKDKDSLLDELLLLEEDFNSLDPISVNVATATAQALQTMNHAERCESLKRKLQDIEANLEPVADSIPDQLKDQLQEDKKKVDTRLDRLSSKLKSRNDAFDGVLPFVTHLQDLENELLPWLDDMTRWADTESGRPAESPEEIQKKIEMIKDLRAKSEAQSGEVEDARMFGESALELVTSYDQDNLDQSSLDLNEHLQDVQQRYDEILKKLEAEEQDLLEKEGLAKELLGLTQNHGQINDYLENLPQPRLNEADLNQHACDIDDKLGDIHVLEDCLRKLHDQFPDAAKSPAVAALLDNIAATKEGLENKKDDLRDKCDTLDALTADINDINNAIKTINPQTYTIPLADIRSVEENEKYQEDLVPRISTLEEKLDKLQAVHKRISQDCNPADAKKLEAKITDLKQKCKEKEKKKNEKMEELKKTKEDLQNFDDTSEKLSNWLDNQINTLKKEDAPSASTDELKAQLDHHNEFTDGIQEDGADLFKNLMKKANDLKSDRLQNDKGLNDKIAELQKKYDTLLDSASDRQKELESAMLEAQNIKDTMDYILPWLIEAENDLLSEEKPGAEIGTISVQQDKQRADQQQLYSHAHLIDTLRTQDTGGLGDEEKEQLAEILSRWDRCNELLQERKDVLAAAFDHLTDFDKTHADVNNFVGVTQAEILKNNEVPLHDVVAVEDMMKKHKDIQDAIVTKSADVELVNNLGEDYKLLTDPSQADIITDKLDQLNKKWNFLLGEAAEREEALRRAAEKTAEVDNKINELMQWLEEQEHYLKNADPVADTYDDLVAQLEAHKKVHSGFDEHQNDYDNIVIMCQELMNETEDPGVGEALDEKLNDLGNKWDSVAKASMARQRAIEEALQICHDFQDSVNAILEWLPEAEKALDSLDAISDEYDVISQQIQELLQLSYFMAEQNTAVEQVCTLGAIREETGPAMSADEAARYKEMKDRYKELWNKIGVRQDELNKRQDELEADEDVANFDLTEWKKRFLRWLDGNHERIIDLFRRFDVNKDGTLSHQEFKDGIMSAGVPTPRSCFPVIIREFDRDDSGDINYREFAAALKRYEFKPKTEGEHIDYEVQRAVDKCMCRRRFNCVQVGEAKYRFGNMQKLYLVRILSTVVMVRVGGGWQPLHEFLQKYDPCRRCAELKIERDTNLLKRFPWMSNLGPAKGRTNVELGKVNTGRAIVSPLKFLTGIKTPGGKGTPRSAPGRGKSPGEAGETGRGRLIMSAGARPSASTEFEGLDIEHDGVKISFPGYKNPAQVKGDYVSPYSCQAMGLKKRSGSSGSLVSCGSAEYDSPVRRSPSKSGSRGNLRSASKSSVVSKSSSRGSVNGGGAARGSYFFPAPTTPTKRTPLKQDTRSNMNSPNARTTPSPRPGNRTPLNRTPTSPSPLTSPKPGLNRGRTQSNLSKSADSRPAGPTRRATTTNLHSTTPPPRQRTGAVSSPKPSPTPRSGTASSIPRSGTTSSSTRSPLANKSTRPTTPGSLPRTGTSRTLTSTPTRGTLSKRPPGSATTTPTPTSDTSKTPRTKPSTPVKPE